MPEGIRIIHAFFAPVFAGRAIQELIHTRIDIIQERDQVCFSGNLRSVYKELHADHETGAADNEIRAEYQAQASERYSACFVVRGGPKGLAPWHKTLLAKCSMLHAL